MLYEPCCCFQSPMLLRLQSSRQDRSVGRARVRTFLPEFPYWNELWWNGAYARRHADGEKWSPGSVSAATPKAQLSALDRVG
jgi:hypothetical protein